MPIIRSLEKTLLMVKTKDKRPEALNGHEFEHTPELVEDREVWIAAAHQV